MNTTLQATLVLGALVFILIIFFFLAKKKLLLKYTLLWIFAALAILLIAIFPNAVLAFGRFIGIVTPANTVFLFAGLFSLLILFAITIILSSNNQRMYKLAQGYALLERRVRELEDALEKQKGIDLAK